MRYCWPLDTRSGVLILYQVASSNASAVNMSLLRNNAELYDKGRKIQNHGEIPTT